MSYPQTVQILQPNYDLGKILLGRLFGQLILIDDFVKKIPVLCKLHDQVQSLRSLYDLVQLNDKRVSHHLHNFDLPAYTLDVCLLED